MTGRFALESLLLVLLVASASGCATYSDKMAKAAQTAATGDYAGGIEQIDKLLGVKESTDMPADWESEETLAVLERGTLKQALSNWQSSSLDMQEADKQLDFIDLSGDAAGQIGKYMYSDSAAKYTASPTEKLSINSFNMLNYLALNDASGASVEARRFTTMRNYLEDYDPENPHGAFGAYLAGFTFEMLGDPSRALRYYDEVLQERPLRSLATPVARLAALSPYRGRAITDFLKDAPAAPKRPQDVPTELLVVVAGGRVPYKVPERMPIGAAVGMAGTWISGNPEVLGYSVFKFVIYPKLVPWNSSVTKASVSIGPETQDMELAANIGAEIDAEYQKMLPQILGAAISRMIVRAVAAEGARAAGRQAGGNAEAASWIAALLTEGLLVAADKPDTRSWMFLPAKVFIHRVQLAPGSHEVRVHLGGAQDETIPFEIELAKGERRVIVVTAPR